MLNQKTSSTKARLKLSTAQKAAVAFLLRPDRPHFDHTARDERLAAEQKAAEEAQTKAAAQAVASDAVGYVMPDGSLYAGISPDTKQPMYVTAKDALACMDFNKAAAYAKDLDAHGHKDWRLPTKEELNLLFQNQGKGALKETFNLTGWIPSGWYWSSAPGGNDTGAWCQNFRRGDQLDTVRNSNSSVRCVR